MDGEARIIAIEIDLIVLSKLESSIRLAISIRNPADPSKIDGKMPMFTDIAIAAKISIPADRFSESL